MVMLGYTECLDHLGSKEFKETEESKETLAALGKEENKERKAKEGQWVRTEQKAAQEIQEEMAK